MGQLCGVRFCIAFCLFVTVMHVLLPPIAGLIAVLHGWQVRECATALLHVAKRQGVPVFLVGHVTKTGELASVDTAASLQVPLRTLLLHESREAAYTYCLVTV